MNVFLTAGINCLTFDAISKDDNAATYAVHVDYIEATAGHGMIDIYEAEAEDNTLSGTAVVMDDPVASGGQYVAQIGNGLDNTLQFNHVNVPSSGTYRMVICFANAEKKGDHQYNIQVVDRYAEITINGRNLQRAYFRNTFSWNTYRTRVIDVDLDAGNNTIKFSNPSANAPHIDKIEIASRF
jgi:Carbohydrate binding module (family 35)